MKCSSSLPPRYKPRPLEPGSIHTCKNCRWSTPSPVSSVQIKAFGEAAQVPWFLPPNPPSILARRSDARLVAARGGGTKARLLLLRFVCLPLAPQPRLLPHRVFLLLGGGLRRMQNAELQWGCLGGCFITAKLDPSERHPSHVSSVQNTKLSKRHPKSYFFSADKSLRRGTPSPPCIAPRDAVERMVVSCERSERGADAGTARKTSIVPRTQ
jgi:hypothetical protein